MTPSEVFLAARGLLLTKGWTQGAYARTIDGTPVWHGSKDARSYCLMGALRCVALNRNVESIAALLYDEIYEEIPNMLGISGYNDAPGRTREEVCDLLLRGAEKSKTPTPDGVGA